MQTKQLLIAAVAALGLALWGLPGAAHAAAGVSSGSHGLADEAKSSVTLVRYRGGAVGLSGSHANVGGWPGRHWGWGGRRFYGAGLGLGWGTGLGYGWGWPYYGTGLLGVGYGVGYPRYGGCRGWGWGW